MFSYYTQEERRLLEKAAKLERRSLSSFVALAALERAQRIWFAAQLYELFCFTFKEWSAIGTDRRRKITSLADLPQ